MPIYRCLDHYVTSRTPFSGHDVRGTSTDDDHRSSSSSSRHAPLQVIRMDVHSRYHVSSTYIYQGHLNYFGELKKRMDDNLIIRTDTRYNNINIPFIEKMRIPDSG